MTLTRAVSNLDKSIKHLLECVHAKNVNQESAIRVLKQATTLIEGLLIQSQEEEAHEHRNHPQDGPHHRNPDEAGQERQG